VTLDRAQTDRLLANDQELSAIDRDRFYLDLTEIVEEAQTIASLPGTHRTASELLTALSGSVAHLTSHWERLTRETNESGVYAELLKSSRSVNEDDLSLWQRLRRMR
jgi:hypothetical protein